MIDLMPVFLQLMETINKYNDISLQIEEQNKSLMEISKRIDKLTEARK